MAIIENHSIAISKDLVQLRFWVCGSCSSQSWSSAPRSQHRSRIGSEASFGGSARRSCLCHCFRACWHWWGTFRTSIYAHNERSDRTVVSWSFPISRRLILQMYLDRLFSYKYFRSQWALWSHSNQLILSDQQKVDPTDVLGPFVQMIKDNPIFQMFEDVDDFLIRKIGMGGSIFVMSRPSSTGYFVGLWISLIAGNRASRKVHKRQWSSLFFTFITVLSCSWQFL